MDRTLEAIFETICRILGLHVDSVRFKCRKTELKMARYFYYYFARDLTNCSLLEIGLVCPKNHATILHGIKFIKDLKDIGRYPNFNADFNLLESEIKKEIGYTQKLTIEEEIFILKRKIIKLKLKLYEGHNENASKHMQAPRPY